MARQRAVAWAAAITLACGTAAPGRAADDPVGDARAALDRHDYPAAVDDLRVVLAGPATDPRRAAAAGLMVTAATAGSDAAVADDHDEAAERMLIGGAELIDPDPRAAELRARGKRVLRDLYGSAVRARAYDRALWAVTTSAADFPADEPLAPAGAVASLRAKAAAGVIRTAGPARAYAVLTGLYAADVPVSVVDYDGVDRAAVGAAYAAALQARGWYAQAAAVAGDTLAVGHLPPAGERDVAAARSAAVAARADACLAFGNRPMAAAAVADTAGVVDPATAGRLRAALDRLADGSPPTTGPAAAATGPATRLPHGPFADLPDAAGPAATGPAAAAGATPTAAVPLKLDAPAAGHLVWADVASGYTLGGGSVRLGNCANEHGGAWAKADVHVGPGCVLADGTLNPSSGTLGFEGTADRPIVVRHVVVDCDYTAQVSARFTLFEDCTFARTGKWHWNNGPSTKWTLADCLLVGCRFKDLNGFEMGLKVDRCGFVGMPFPPRAWTGRKAPTDARQGPPRRVDARRRLRLL